MGLKLTLTILLSLSWYLLGAMPLLSFARSTLALAQGPTFEVLTHTVEAEPGFIFTTPDAHTWLLVTDNAGHPVFSKQANAVNLQVWGERLSYFDNDAPKFVMLNDSYEPVDEWAAVGYPTDVHDLRLLDNGGALLLVYHEFPYDMSLIVPGGSPTATVVSCIIQELNPDKSLAWEWDSANHLPITQTNVSLTANRIDYSHCNALEIDTDGNLLLSHRHLDEVTKINRQTGAVMWRLGGQGNEFTFTNDDGFALQHDIRRIAGGHITLFDNGRPARGYSRAVEYELDEVGKLITRTWEYRGAFAFCCGNVQRLPGDGSEEGNTLINFGPAYPTIIEVNPEGEIVFAADVAFSYRSFKAPWQVKYYLPVIFK